MCRKLALILLLFTGIVKAQNVTIPDTTFKNVLLAANSGNDTANHMVIDADGNGEISEIEAQAITFLSVSEPISDFTGLEAFVSLQDLWIFSSLATSLPLSTFSQLDSIILTYNNNLTTLDLSNLPSLQSFQASGNASLGNLNFNSLTNLHQLVLASHPAMTSVDVSQLPNLNDFSCNGNANITNFNLGTIDSIIYLECQANQNSSLDLSHLVNLQSLLCGYNSNLTNLDLTGLTNLVTLSCQDTDITALDLNLVPNLESLNFSGTSIADTDLSILTKLTSLRCNNTPITSLDVTNMPLLQHLEFDNTSISAIDLSNNPALIGLGFSNTGITSMNWPQLTQLQYLHCANTDFTELDLNGFTSLNSLSCGGTILQRLFIKNGINETLTLTDSPNLEFICADDTQIAAIQAQTQLHAAAAAVSSYCSFTPGGDYNSIIGKVRFDLDNNGCDTSDLNFPLNVRMNMAGPFASSTFVNASGNYALYAQSGSYTVTPAVEYPDFFNVTPASVAVDFPLPGNTQSIQDFCITSNGTHPDLEVVFVPIGIARPGFDANYKIIYRNKGNQLQSGQVNLSFDDAVLDLVSATPAVSNQEPNLLSWNFSALMPFETRSIDLVLNVNSPMETPAVNNGDTLAYSAQITNSEGEETPSDNTFHHNQIVVNSYDPNDKACLEGSNVLPEFIGKFLHYNINFENTGTADAVNIVVRDVIDTTKFDINTLQVQYASHPVETKITGNVVEFIFENINLPSSITSPIGGHGNVLFKIRTLPTLALNDEVANTANIFFDYNFPIATNEARTVFSLLAKNDFVKDNKVSVYPNPAKDIVWVKADSNILSVQLYDVQGRILQTSMLRKKETTLDLSAKQAGVYFLKITTEKGTATHKIAKE